jgi:hypothetical protein
MGALRRDGAVTSPHTTITQGDSIAAYRGAGSYPVGRPTTFALLAACFEVLGGVPKRCWRAGCAGWSPGSTRTYSLFADTSPIGEEIDANRH